MNKKEVITFEDIELYYNKCRKIKFSKETEDPKDIEEAFTRMITNTEKTVYIREGHQCKTHRARSLDDFIKLCKYYFDISVLDILKFIENYYISKTKVEVNKWGNRIKEEAHYFGYCDYIRKNNFHGMASYWNIGSFYDTTFARNGFINYDGNYFGTLLK